MKFINNIHNTPLHLAAKRKNIEIIKLLLSNKDININLKDDIFT